jgi:hypothetical protein
MKESNTESKLNMQEMWSLMNKEDTNWGIEGYEAPRKFIGKNTEGKIALTDKDGKKIIWKRPNYLDDV